MLLQCPAISLDLQVEWKTDIRYLTQITSESQTILTNIFCWCRVHIQFLVFAIKKKNHCVEKKKVRVGKKEQQT